MSILKEILLQLFFALAPFVIYNIYYRDKIRNYSRSFIIITSSVCLFLSMTFASSAVDGFIFDIRYVIMFFALVYGGIQTGLILLVEFVIYRLYLGGEGKWIAMVILICTFPLSILLYKMYKHTQRKSLIIFIAGILFSIIPLILLYQYNSNYIIEHLTFHIFVNPVQNSIGIWLLMSLFNKSVSDKEIFIKHAENEKMKAISHVAASLAHEIRNPLTAVKGFLKLIRRNPHDIIKIEQYIDISMDEIQRTEAILTEYLSISKPLTEHRELINFSDQLHIIIDVMTPYANMNNVQLKVYTPVDPIKILANPAEIKQFLVNFIKNAVEACFEAPNGKVCLELIVEDKNATLLIEDNGIGMNEEQINRLGSIYFSNKTSGTGLGLTYSYQVIRAIGGVVTVSSKPNWGTKFTITLPLTETEKINNTV